MQPLEISHNDKDHYGASPKQSTRQKERNIIHLNIIHLKISHIDILYECCTCVNMFDTCLAQGHSIEEVCLK